MSVRIFVKFRTHEVPCDPGRKLKFIADAACSASLGRHFDYEKDFLHSQGEIYSVNAPCHVLIDCEYQQFPIDPKEIPLRCYAVKSDNLHDGPLILEETNLHRGQIDIVPWGRHSS
ncbi:hypothetical protein BDV96DRAFT_592738 [Lophiotrema nucula]|uniref:Uncharacterized protein n=1 Tax=Lophiotrema nucula TaxID=690887 RepID=A0A6A5YG58_9PLEO|nr:hypothetical protein BDV96DRAFT_592738 [Lophiotrema nucula]